MRLLAVRVAVGFALVGSLLAVLLRPALAPAPAMVALAGSAVPWLRAWRSARGTALRPALAWAGAAMIVAFASQAVAMIEPFGGGRPAAGQCVYLATLGLFAAMISVFNARTPGGGAWALLMAMLIVVFLVPWLEGAGLVREGGGWDRLHLSAPWTIFYGLIVVAGVSNFLPTRLAPAAIALGVGLLAEYIGLTRVDLSRPTRGTIWTLVATCWGVAAWAADLVTIRPSALAPGLPRLWARFRDAWGVVWGLRVLDRFNRTAESARWPIRLSWQGVVPATGDEARSAEIPPEAAATLAGLLRRFATAGRLAEWEDWPDPIEPWKESRPGRLDERCDRE